MGLIVNADLQLWDYTENFGNIMGQVCLQNTLAFGVAASIIAWFVYPMMEKWIARVQRDIMNIVFVVVLVVRRHHLVALHHHAARRRRLGR